MKLLIKPITLPKGVKVKLDGDLFSVTGPLGTMSKQFPVESVSVEILSGDPIQIKCAPLQPEIKESKSISGTVYSLIRNMIKGVSEGFVKKLEFVGVGYRGSVKGQELDLSLGYSHPVRYVAPKGIVLEMPTNISIIIKGVDKQLVGQVASQIRSFREPECYKGKGVRYSGENVIIKETKKKS